MITREQIRECYLLVLGRPPENEKVVDHYMTAGLSIPQIRDEFLRSEEFAYHYAGRMGAAPSAHLPDALAPNFIEWKLEGANESAFFDQVRRAWESLGEAESYWSVLTDDQFKSGSIEANREKFFASAKKETDLLWNTLSRNEIDCTKIKSVLEFGCGVGRVTSWLAKQFPHVYGIDISKNHLSIARDEMKRVGISNVEFMQSASVEALATLPKVDLVFTTIVLQHNPPPVIAKAISALLSILNPGGYAYFQVPTYRMNYHFSAAKWLEQNEHGMEMHPLPQRVIFELIREAGCEVLEVSEDDSTGRRNFFRSNVFLVGRR